MANKIRLGFIGANVAFDLGFAVALPGAAGEPGCRDDRGLHHATPRPRKRRARPSARSSRSPISARWWHRRRSTRWPSWCGCRRTTSRPRPRSKPASTSIPSGRSAAPPPKRKSWRRWPARRGVQTAVGLQSRVSPALLYMKELIEEGYVGEVLSCHADCMRDGALERPSSRTWQRDVSLGANPLTIANGHVIDALRFVVGDFARVSCMVTTQAKQWYETDTKKMVDVTSPGQHPGQRQARERRGGLGARRGRAVGGRRLSDGDLRARRHAGRDRQRLVAARRDAAGAGRAAQPRA